MLSISFRIYFNSWKCVSGQAKKAICKVTVADKNSTSLSEGDKILDIVGFTGGKEAE